MKDKFIRKYLAIAKTVGEVENPCHSRKIGSVIVDPQTNKIVGTGYNGPPRGTPHCTSERYLRMFFLPQLKNGEKNLALQYFGACSDEEFIEKATDCNICPRRMIGALTGKRSELCSCEHSEKNAIYNAGCNLHGTYIFVHSCSPCFDCSKAIINSGIKKVYFSGSEIYNKEALWLLEQGGVEVHSYNINEESNNYRT